MRVWVVASVGSGKWLSRFLAGIGRSIGEYQKDEKEQEGKGTLKEGMN